MVSCFHSSGKCYKTRKKSTLNLWIVGWGGVEWGVGWVWGGGGVGGGVGVGWGVGGATRGAILLKNPPVRAYRRSENLRDILVRAKLKPLNTQQTKHIQQPCTHQDCQTCKLLKRHNVLPTKNRDMKLVQSVDCNTNNVAYLLECNKCNKQYVGETKRKFIIRFKEHLADIRHNRDTPVAKHYNLISHKNNTTPIFPIPSVLSRITGHPDRTTDERKNKEKMWIYTLRSIAPNGINLRE